MAHRQLLRRAVLAVGLASAVGAFAQGAPVPPGAEAPGYGGDEIETIIVIGDKLRCPDGTRVATINECPGFIQSWLNRVYRLPWDPITHVIMASIPNAPTCGATVDASCECGTGKVKVYDEDADAFHCYAEPPAAGCPKWDQTFDFDLSVWACVTRPFDASVVDAAERIKNCVGGVISANWFQLSTLLRWGSAGGNWGAVGCPRNEITYVELNQQLYERRAVPGRTSQWQYMAHTLIHEALHVRDVAKYKTCEPWKDETMQILMIANGGWPHTELGYEAYTHMRTLDEYRAQLGVDSPRDPFNYDPAVHGNVPCPLH